MSLDIKFKTDFKHQTINAWQIVCQSVSCEKLNRWAQDARMNKSSLDRTTQETVTSQSVTRVGVFLAPIWPLFTINACYIWRNDQAAFHLIPGFSEFMNQGVIHQDHQSRHCHPFLMSLQAIIKHQSLLSTHCSRR